jgi:hypothetical protein
MTEAEGIFISGLIATPAGAYEPQTDNLVDALKEAAKFAGLVHFKAFVNGNQIKSFADMPCELISQLEDVPRVEGIESSITVERYDRAG